MLQGAFILAKATGDATVAGESIDHLRRYIEFLFRVPSSREKSHENHSRYKRRRTDYCNEVWRTYTTPDNIKQWNTASDDWHTTAASVDLREGGAFSSRMEAKDGSMGFDFAGTYTKIVPQKLIEYSFGGSTAKVEFTEGVNGVNVRVTFDAETTHSNEQQRSGWQAILNNFARHVEKSQRAP